MKAEIGKLKAEIENRYLTAGATCSGRLGEFGLGVQASVSTHGTMRTDDTVCGAYSLSITLVWFRVYLFLWL